jgi:folate-binding protein YgfZ
VSDLFPSAPAPTVTRLERDAVPAEIVDQLRAGAIVAPADVGVIDLTGSGEGAITCFQGLLTNDIEKPGDGAFVYGALLTPKGMIVVDGWAARAGSRVRFTVPAEGRERAMLVLQRSVPPRLARSTDRTDEIAVLRVTGAHAVAVMGAAGLPIPQVPNRVVEGSVGRAAVEVARTSDLAFPPFVFQVTTAGDQAAVIQQRLVEAGTHVATPEALDLARILAGWPRLTSEVDEKTIPQEVRFDEIGGVSYTKGCYTGQETVSRLHFRGHANRQLRGLMFETDPPATPASGWSAVTHEEREVGRVTSIAWLPDGGGSVLGRWIGLAIVRREVPPGATVRAAGREARVVALPFDAPRVAPA